MKVEEIIQQLGSAKNLVPAQRAEQAPDKPGLYAIFIDTPSSLPHPFDKLLSQKRKPRLIYVGQAQSLHERLAQDLCHEGGPSTFFRSIGAILGYRPPRGSLKGKKNQDNYTFSGQDTKAIIRWINTHLSVTYIEISTHDLALLEKEIIRQLQPLLNIQHNPSKLEELEDLRDSCRRIARS